MKKLITLVSLVIINLYCFSQPDWNIVFDNDIKSFAKDLTILNDSIILIGGNADVNSCYFPILEAYDFKGHKLWRKNIGADALQTKDTVLYSVGYKLFPCEYSEYLTFSKFNKDGDSITYAEYDSETYCVDDHGYYDVNLLDLEITPNKEFLFLSDTNFLKADSSGMVLWKKDNSSLGNYNDVSVIDETKYLVSKNNKLLLIDSSSLALDSIAFSEEIKENIIVSDTIYCLLNDASVISIGTSLELLDTINLSPVFDAVYHLKRDSTYLWISGNKDDKYIFQSYKLNTETTKTYDMDTIIDYISFEVIGNELFILGNSKSEQIGLIKYTLPFESASLEKNSYDIVFEDLVIDSILISENSYDLYSKAVIFNDGMDTIRSVAIYSQLEGGFNCSRNQKYYLAENLSIPPGEKDTINIGKIFQYGRYTTNTICFECLSPNSSPEFNVSNNFICKTVDVYNGIESKVYPSEIKIYPNPFKDEFTVSAPFKIQKLMLTDISGKVIIQKNNVGKEIHINLASRKQGFYILFLTSNEETITIKLLRE